MTLELDGVGYGVAMTTLVEDLSANPPVRGFLDRPTRSTHGGLVLAHGAGSNARAPLLIAAAEAFCATGISVLRCDLPFRQVRPHGPPFPAMAAQDRAGLARAVTWLRETVSGNVYLGGHSYGGRQATMLAAEQPAIAAGMLLLSYPLHPPRRPAELRTAHFPGVTTPALFIHGMRDPFGTVEEMQSAMTAIPAPHELVVIPGAGHDLGGKTALRSVAQTAVQAFLRFFALTDELK